MHKACRRKRPVGIVYAVSACYVTKRALQKWLVAVQAEHRVLQAFRQDPFGCSGSLMSKKRDRDPFAVGPYSSDRCTELEPILHHCEDAQPQTYLDVATVVPWETLQ